MHVEVPKKGALASFREFTGEYTMIVISILTALALEHGAQSWHHKHQAHEAEQRIAAEMANNLTELQEAIARNDAELKKYLELRQFLLKGINEGADKTGQAKADYDKQFKLELNEKLNRGLNMSASSPSLRRDAWEVAVASQAASWMEAAPLQSYSSVYTMQRDLMTLMATCMTTITGPTIMGAVPHLQIKGRGNKEQELFQLVSEYCATLGHMLRNMRELESTLKKNAGKT